MNPKKAIYILIFCLSLYSIFLLGQLGYVYQLNLMKPEIENISEINPKICTFNIEDFNNTYIRGSISSLNARFIYKDSIFLTDKNGNFEIVK